MTKDDSPKFIPDWFRLWLKEDAALEVEERGCILVLVAGTFEPVRLYVIPFCPIPCQLTKILE